MNHIISLPARREIRAAIDCSIAQWARRHDLPPAAVHVTIQRYADRDIDMTRVWGAQTPRIIRALHEAVQAAAGRDAA